MKKLVLLATLLGLAIPTAASAKTLEGRFGVGGEAGLTPGHGGLSLKYWAGNFGIQGLIGMQIATFDSTADGVADPDSITNLQLDLRALYNFARTEQTNLYVGGGVALGLIDADSFGIELLLGAEHFFSDWFSVSGIVGLPIALGVEVAPGIESTSASLGSVINWGGGFHFYF